MNRRLAVAGSLVAIGAAATGGFIYTMDTDVHPLVTIALLALALWATFGALAVLNARPARRVPQRVILILIETAERQPQVTDETP